MGIAFSNGYLSLWVCDVHQKIKNSSRLSDPPSFVLPKISKPKKDNEKDLTELQDIVGHAVQKVNNIE